MFKHYSANLKKTIGVNETIQLITQISLFSIKRFEIFSCEKPYAVSSHIALYRQNPLFIHFDIQ